MSTHWEFYYYYFFFFFFAFSLYETILGILASTSETGNNSIEAKKSVTFDDGIKPGVETTATSAAAVAATNIMSSHKIRSNEIDTDQVSLFKAGLIWQTLSNM